MNRWHGGSAVLVMLLFFLVPMAGAESLPSYQSALEAFHAQRKTAAGPKLSAVDRQIMARTGLELAAAMPDPGLRVGEKAPGFELPNANGDPRSLHGLLQQGPIVLTFYRGAWCPYCNLQLKGLRDSIPAFRQAGATLVAVTPQRPDKSLEQLRRDTYTFEILSDLDSSVMKAYRLYFEIPDTLSDVYKRNFQLDLAAFNGEGRYVLPVPATYVIDRAGIVRAAWADTDYKWRVEPAEILAALQGLKSLQR